MNPQIIGPLIIASLLLCVSFGITTAAEPSSAARLAEGNAAFALDLYSQLKAQPGNLFFSPYSISTCLAMTYAGARGETEQQMAKVFHFGSDQHQLHLAFGELQRGLKTAEEQKGIELNIANALWTQPGHPFLEPFLKVARNEYQANVNQADFKTSAESARGQINRWVEEVTKEKIKDILPPASLTPDTRLVLANAIYFKGVWAAPFKKAETRPQPFHFTPTRQADVPCMHHVDTVKYMENDTLQAVELPYSSNRLSMVIVLPRLVDGCSQLETTLTPEFLQRTLAQMKKQKVELFLPRFKMESGANLNRDLAKMGMTDAFGSKADFSGIDGTHLLYISAIFHKAWVEVNEEGTEAAAATATTITAMAVQRPPAPPPVFRADHPFLFFIRDTQSGSLLFLGRMAEPA
jgi:serine protease inhibitor